MDMTAVKTGVGLLYFQSSAEIYKQLKTELTNRCPDIEVQADVVVVENTGGFACYSGLSKYSTSSQARSMMIIGSRLKASFPGCY